MEKLKENFDVHRNEIESAGLEVPETVPLMRSVFISKDSKAVKAIKREVEEKTENTRLKDSDTIDDWVIIGEPKEVRDMLDQYIEQLGMNYLIASRVRASGIDSKVLEESMALLAEISE